MGQVATKEFVPGQPVQIQDDATELWRRAQIVAVGPYQSGRAPMIQIRFADTNVTTWIETSQRQVRTPLPPCFFPEIVDEGGERRIAAFWGLGKRFQTVSDCWWEVLKADKWTSMASLPVCLVCGQISPTEGACVRHMQQHPKELQDQWDTRAVQLGRQTHKLVCSLCGDELKSDRYDMLMQHTKQHHPKEFAQASSLNELLSVKRVKCDVLVQRVTDKASVSGANTPSQFGRSRSQSVEPSAADLVPRGSPAADTSVDLDATISVVGVSDQGGGRLNKTRSPSKKKRQARSLRRSKTMGANSKKGRMSLSESGRPASAHDIGIDIVGVQEQQPLTNGARRRVPRATSTTAAEGTVSKPGESTPDTPKSTADSKLAEHIPRTNADLIAAGDFDELLFGQSRKESKRKQLCVRLCFGFTFFMLVALVVFYAADI